MCSTSRGNSSLVTLPGPRADMVRRVMEVPLVVSTQGGTAKVQFLDIRGGIAVTLDRQDTEGYSDFGENGSGLGHGVEHIYKWILEASCTELHSFIMGVLLQGITRYLYFSDDAF